MKQPSQREMAQDDVTDKHTQISQCYIYKTSSTEPIKLDTAVLNFLKNVINFNLPWKLWKFRPAEELSFFFSVKIFIFEVTDKNLPDSITFLILPKYTRENFTSNITYTTDVIWVYCVDK